MAMDFPARHDKSSLNCRPGALPRGTSNSMMSVATEAAALAGIFVAPHALYVAFSFGGKAIAFRFCEVYWDFAAVFESVEPNEDRVENEINVVVYHGLLMIENLARL